MDKISKEVLGRVRVLCEKAGSGVHPGQLAIQGSVVFDHRDHVLRWRVGLAHFNSEECASLQEAFDQIEHAIGDGR